MQCISHVTWNALYIDIAILWCGSDMECDAFQMFDIYTFDSHIFDISNVFSYMRYGWLCLEIHITQSTPTYSIHACTVLTYGVATISRLLKIVGLFCKRTLYYVDCVDINILDVCIYVCAMTHSRVCHTAFLVFHIAYSCSRHKHIRYTHLCCWRRWHMRQCVSHMLNTQIRVCQMSSCTTFQTYSMYAFTVLTYGVATMSRLLKIIGLFCRRSSLL